MRSAANSGGSPEIRRTSACGAPGSSVAALRDGMVRARAFRPLPELLTSLGGHAEALLRGAQVDPAVFDGDHDVVSYLAIAQAMERAAQSLACPDLGMRLAAIQSGQDATKVLGPLDIALRNAPTLGAAFQYWADHSHAYCSATRMAFEKLPGEGRIFMLMELTLDDAEQPPQIMEHALALTRHAVRTITGGRAQPREVWFTHEPIAPMSVYRTHFDAPLRFGQSMSGLFFDEQDFALPMPEPDEQLYELATSFIERRFPAAPVSLSTRVRIIIARLLADDTFTHERVAAALGMHPRALQRKLREEGESFEAIKDRVRRDVALRCLRQSNISLMRMTEILGYSETSVLARSCNRWFAASPRKLRKGVEAREMAAQAAM